MTGGNGDWLGLRIDLRYWQIETWETWKTWRDMETLERWRHGRHGGHNDMGDIKALETCMRDM